MYSFPESRLVTWGGMCADSWGISDLTIPSAVSWSSWSSWLSAGLSGPPALNSLLCVSIETFSLQRDLIEAAQKEPGNWASQKASTLVVGQGTSAIFLLCCWEQCARCSWVTECLVIVKVYYAQAIRKMPSHADLGERINCPINCGQGSLSLLLGNTLAWELWLLSPSRARKSLFNVPGSFVFSF